MQHFLATYKQYFEQQQKNLEDGKPLDSKTFFHNHKIVNYLLLQIKEIIKTISNDETYKTKKELLQLELFDKFGEDIKELNKELTMQGGAFKKSRRRTHKNKKTKKLIGKQRKY
jgi:hypothetical protein